MTETTSPRRRGRKLAGILAGGLALSVLPFAVPASAQVTPRDIAEACPPAEIPSGVFDDVDDASTHADAIDCVAAYEITVGNEDGDYEPGSAVPREQMATFIARLVDYVSDTDNGGDGTGLPDFDLDDENNFPCDVFVGAGTTLNPHYVNINRLALATYDDDADPETPAQAIVEGTGDNADGEACFSPGNDVTREQMASFINRAEAYLGEAITPDDDYFDDDDNSIHEENIDAIATEQIAAGVTGRTYDPGGNVERDQMASFLARKLDYLIQDAMAYTDTPPPNAIVTLDASTVVEGGTLSGTVSTASTTDITGVSVAGTCLATNPSALTNDADNTVDFDIELDTGLVADDAEDDLTCDLVFTTTFDGGDTDDDDVTIIVTDDPADDADEV